MMNNSIFINHSLEDDSVFMISCRKLFAFKLPTGLAEASLRCSGVEAGLTGVSGFVEDRSFVVPLTFDELNVLSYGGFWPRQTKSL
ncbi:hypothetical protein, partial [Shigella flexneri]|uniref:hypothetical protein n=1 Tax=Shigella flexneri TaxID=623 RepID=UPI001C0A7E5B